MPLLRCLTPFPGGTKLTVQQRQYHFLANQYGHAVADVREDDVPTILSIGAGYQRYDEPALEDAADEVDGEDVFDEINPEFTRAASAPPKDADEAVGTVKAKPLAANKGHKAKPAPKGKPTEPPAAE